MNIQKKLSRLGIEVLDAVDKKDVNYIAHYITNVITQTFPVLQDQYNEILAKILNCKMYYAKVGENIADVNYVYDDDSIYIEQNIDIFEPNEQLFREVIHYLQVRRNNKGKIKTMGLCNFSEFSIKGLGLNEGIVQYMAARMFKNEKEHINKYGIYLFTISPTQYPMLTNLVEQLIYLLGESSIVRATIGVDSEFEDEFFNTFEEKGNTIIKNIDRILDLKSELSLQGNGKSVDMLEAEVANLYLNTQEIMLKKYYNNIIPRLTKIEEVDFYIEKFLSNEKVCGIKDDLEFIDAFKEFKDEIIKKFDKQLMKISKEKGKNTLSSYNKIGALFGKVAGIFKG